VTLDTHIRDVVELLQLDDFQMSCSPATAMEA
jgi:hypothetical protein